jgi:capsular polysaccharide biosynthesis protein
MMRYKQEVVAQHGLDRGFEIFAQQFGLPTSARLRECRVESDRTYLEHGSAFFVETGVAGQPFVNMPPRVIGEGNHRPLAARTRSDFVACVTNAVIRGRSAFVQVNGRLLLDVQPEEVGRLDDEVTWDPLIFHSSGGRVWRLDKCDRVAPRRLKEAFTLLGAHTDFFGHWMCEYLPRFVAARLSGHVPDAPVLVDSHMPPSHRASLESLYGAVLPIVEIPFFTSVRVDRLWYAPAPSYMPLHEIRNEKFSWDSISVSGERLVPVIAEMQRLFDVGRRTVDSGSRRLYLARRELRHRYLVNSAVIEEIARNRGFLVSYPEDLPFDEQLSLVRSAKLIVAPEGSALFLAMFARPGTKVCILSHPFTDLLSDYNGLLQPHGITLVVITGPITRSRPSSPNDADYAIDVGVFTKAMDELLSDPTSN